MSLPNTIGVMQQIQSLITASGANYRTIAIGAVKDWTGVDPICEIGLSSDSSAHFAHGGRIEDTQGFRITTAVLFASSTSPTPTPTQAVTTLCGIRDVVVPLFQQKAYLGGLAGVADSRVKPGNFTISFITVGGNDYIVHEFEVEVRSMYNIVVPDGG